MPIYASLQFLTKKTQNHKGNITWYALRTNIFKDNVSVQN